jgi:hypothetical protein
MFKVTALPVRTRARVLQSGRRIRRLPQIVLPEGAVIKLHPGRAVVISEDVFAANKESLRDYADLLRVRNMESGQLMVWADHSVVSEEPTSDAPSPIEPESEPVVDPDPVDPEPELAVEIEPAVESEPVVDPEPEEKPKKRRGRKKKDA